MQDNKTSYRSIFKATSLFGGLQVYQILIQIIKGKIIAVLLGPAGVGIIGLFQSGLDMVKNLTSMGLASSAVRDVSEANATNDIQRISNTLSVVKRLTWITGIIGGVVVIIASPLLSRSLFGNYDYTIPFILLSIILLFDQVSAGQRVILQGLRRLKDLARCSAVGYTSGLIASVPFYYWMGIKGIVPTLIITSICSLFVSWWYSQKVKIKTKKIPIKESFVQGRQMLIMGISMSLSGILATLVAYVTRGYIQSIGGVEEVGLYHAGSVIMTTYVGLIMNAIATDYYPRLASINKDDEQCKMTVCQQGEIGIMILAPLLVLCLVFMPFVLRILYSKDFLEANLYIAWACLGMALRFASWIISFMFVAKADSKLFVINELLGCAYSLIFNILGYNILGLQGLGIAFALSYLVYFIQVYLISHKRYGFNFSREFVKSFGAHLLIITGVLVLVLITDGVIKYSLGTIFIVISIYLGIRGLNQRLDLISIFKHKV